MTNLDNKLEDYLKNLFQSHIKIVSNGNTIIDGRFIIYSVRTFSFALTIKTKKGVMKKIIFPRPFNCDKYNENTILCDYRFETMAGGEKAKLSQLKKIKVYERSQFYDTTAEIIRIPPEPRMENNEGIHLP